MKTTSLLIVFFLCCLASSMKAQYADTSGISPDSSSKVRVDKKKVYSRARRATIFSAVLPGLGQAYNKKYWKIPIIYAGLGGFGYMFAVNNKEYAYYRENLVAIFDEDPNTVNKTGYSDWQLESLRDQYKKNRDFAVIGLGIIYLLNIIDANVDGHLSTFDVSDDLSLHIDPWQNFNFNASGLGSAAGLSLTLKFK